MVIRDSTTKQVRRNFPIRLRVHHHKSDVVEAMVVVNGRDFERALCPALRAMSQSDAADQVARFVTKLSGILSKAIRRLEAEGPTNDAGTD